MFSRAHRRPPTSPAAAAYLAALAARGPELARLLAGARIAVVLIEGRATDARMARSLSSIDAARPDLPLVVLYAGADDAPFARAWAARPRDAALWVRDAPTIPDVTTYSEILMHPDFYAAFAPAQHLLITQADAAMARRPEMPLERFLEFDYCGALLWHNYVGNGGFSLRDRARCERRCREVHYSGRVPAEDRMFSAAVPDDDFRLLPRELAPFFAVESRYFDHEAASLSRSPARCAPFEPAVVPAGMHQMNVYFPREWALLQAMDPGFAAYGADLPAAE